MFTKLAVDVVIDGLLSSSSPSSVSLSGLVVSSRDDLVVASSFILPSRKEQISWQ